MTPIYNRFESKSLTDLSCSKGGTTVSKMCPTDKAKARQEAVNRDTLRSRLRVYCEVNQSSYTNKPKATGDGFYWSCLWRGTMKLTRWLLKRTSKLDYLVTQHLEVNATYRWLPHERYVTKHCRKAQKSAGTLELGKYNHLRKADMLDINK
jgi:hypothetical protein